MMLLNSLSVVVIFSIEKCITLSNADFDERISPISSVRESSFYFREEIVLLFF